MGLLYWQAEANVGGMDTLQEHGGGKSTLVVGFALIHCLKPNYDGL